MLKAFSIVLLGSLVGACAATRTSEDEELRQAEMRLRISSVELVYSLADTTKTYLKSHTEQEAISSAQEAVKYDLKDPYSAHFRNVRIVSFANGKVICGEVNAKNVYGAYVGFTRFVASPFNRVLEETGSSSAKNNSLRNSGLNAACK